MTTQPENKDNAEPKNTKDELNEKELEKASGGVTFTYGKLKTDYVQQKPDGTTN